MPPQRWKGVPPQRWEMEIRHKQGWRRKAVLAPALVPEAVQVLAAAVVVHPRARGGGRQGQVEATVRIMVLGPDVGRGRVAGMGPAT